VAQHYTDELQQARDRFNEILDAREADADSTLFERRFAYADPATTLLEEAERADLLIVGPRGHSGLSAAILGSVSTHVLHHSPVPVVIVPGSD
jgi:nucleotide-binding universal stress UspA family protein